MESRAWCGENVVFDIWSISVGHVHGGHQYVIGFHDQHSTLTKVYLIARKSDAQSAIREYLNWARSHGVKVSHMHGDGAPELTGLRMQIWLRLKGVHLTWRAPHEPRGNGMMERCWRTICRDARAARATSNLPAEWWWYCFRQACETSWIFEIPGHPGVTPWRRWTGAKPRCMGIRPIGCLAYVKDYFPGNKSNERGVRTIHCGRCPTQPGYQCWDPVRKKMLVSPHVTFDENVFPGLYRTAGGWDAVGTPAYARSSGGDPTWRPAGDRHGEGSAQRPTVIPIEPRPDPSTDEDMLFGGNRDASPEGDGGPAALRQ